MKYLFLFPALFLSLGTAMAARYYVAPQATDGNGSSWESPTSLADALSRVHDGDVIWVRTGTYVPATERREVSFSIPAGVKVYGGFGGFEQTPGERASGATSTLSGDIGTPEDAEDNLYTVVRLLSNGQSVSTLNGFVIRDGYARAYTQGYSPRNAGGGLYVDANSNHRISNCTFENNEAHNGGGVFIDGGRPSFANCYFRDNRSDFNGGAVYNQGSGTSATPMFRHCTFERNTSNSGGGITNNGYSGVASPLFLSCTFQQNYSLITGSCIYNLTKGNGQCDPVITDCEFDGNGSILGGDVKGETNNPGTAGSGQRTQGSGSLRPVKR